MDTIDHDRFLPDILLMEALDGTDNHKKMVEKIILPLSKIANLKVASQCNWYGTIPCNVKLIEYKVRVRAGGARLNNLMRSAFHLYKAWRLDRQYDFDHIFFTSYHTVVMVFTNVLFRGQQDKIYILHHNNIDSFLHSGIKSVLFSLYARNVHHVVYEGFIGNKLMKHYHIPKNHIHILPHPLGEIVGNSNRKYDYVGISSSNDEDWIRNIIEEESHTKKLKNNKVTVVLRSAVYQYDDGYLKVFSGWLSFEEYYDYATGGRCMLLPFPLDFQYRMSASLCDALANNIKVIGSDIPLFREYESRYPKICKTGISLDGLINDSSAWLNDHGMDETSQFEKFRKRHSQVAIKRSLNKIFCGEELSVNDLLTIPKGQGVK